jgi:hypothetical protein
LLVLGECDSFDEAISFMAALEMMDGAVATFEVMLLIGCSDEHPGHFKKVLEALCVDNTRSSRCTTILGGCDSGERPFDWSEIANGVSRTVTHTVHRRRPSSGFYALRKLLFRVIKGVRCTGSNN